MQTGTLPSKTLKETAIYLSGVRDQGVYGIERKLEHSAGIKDFYYRKNQVSKISSDETKANLLAHLVDVFHGTASFIDSHRVHVRGEKSVDIIAKHILIATGSYPFHIPGIPFDGKHVHDSDTILTLERFPKSLVIVGAGVIGCEYATIFAVLGCKVTLVNSNDKFLPFIDQEIIGHLKTYMEDHGVNFLMGNRVDSVSIQNNNDDAVVHAQLSNNEPIEADMFLYAAGRSGNIKNLNLEAVGIETGERETILVNEHYQTNIPHIYAVGDVIGFPALASTSMDQGRVAVANIFDLDDLKQINEQIPYGIYTIPEVSTVGLTERECREQNIPYGIGRAYVEKMPRGRIMGYTKGMLKLIHHKETEEVLGVHIVGAIATEIIHLGMIMVQNKMKLNSVISMIYNFPTMHELYKYAAYNAIANKEDTPPPR